MAAISYSSLKTQEVGLLGHRKLSRFFSSILFPFLFWGPVLTPNSRKKGALIAKGVPGEARSAESEPFVGVGLLFYPHLGLR